MRRGFWSTKSVFSVLLLAATVQIVALAQCAAGGETGFVHRAFEDQDGSHRYVVYVPDSYSPDASWPIVLYLHGAGSCGTDGELHLCDGLAPVIRAQGRYPAVVVFPQCEELDAPLLTRWLADSPDGRRAVQILEEVERDYSIDSSRRVLAGWSMGGYGAWSLAAAEPERWSAVVAVSGGGDPEVAARVKAPVWAIHGAGDRAIRPEQSRTMVEALNGAGGKGTLSLLADVPHDAWRFAFLSQAVRDWMLSTAPSAPDTDRLAKETLAMIDGGQAEALDGEFYPALIVPRAVSLHVGNSALRTLASGAPSAIDPQFLSGMLDDQNFEFRAVGETFQVTLEDLSFEVDLERVLAETSAAGTVRLRVALHPLSISIGETHVRSATRTADAGPTTIRIGHRHPMWMDFSLRPAIADGRIRLGLERAEFEIPDSNWVVNPPDSVQVSGPDLTPELAQVALVGGLYVRREQIERYIRDALPGLISSLEQRMQPARLDRLVTSMWPMPVFRPRLRMLPEEIAVDADGLSLVLGIAAAPFQAQDKPAAPRVTPPMGPHAAQLGKTSGLEIGVSPGVLQALSGMFVDAHAARIDVRDMPEPEFAELGDRRELTRILPQLATLGADVELRTELDLAAPLVVERSETAGAVQFTSTGGETATVAASLPAPAEVNESDSLAARFEIPRLVVSVLIRDRSQSPEWRPYATFDVRVSQRASLELAHVDHLRREARLSWCGEPEIHCSGQYADASDAAQGAIDLAHLSQLVQDCWNAWTGGGTALPEIPDLVLGAARLRIDTIRWRDSELLATYQTPETLITNTGTRIVEYAVRSPFSGWSERQRLQPGETDRYATSGSLIVRRYPQPVSSAAQVEVGGLLDLAGE